MHRRWPSPSAGSSRRPGPLTAASSWAPAGTAPAGPSAGRPPPASAIGRRNGAAPTSPAPRQPTAAELDRASYGGVVYLARTDVHSAVASSALLAAAPETRAAQGFLGEGLVRQDAHHVVRRAAYAAVSPAQRRSAQLTTL